MLYLLITIFSLFSLSLHSEEGVKTINTSEVSEITLSDVNWTQPKDGSTPQIISWSLKISLDNGQELFTTSIEQDAAIDIHTFFKRGDKITLIKESYFLNDPKQSWFHLSNQTTNKESILRGPSSRDKPSLEGEDIFYVKHPIITQNANGKWMLSFHIKDFYVSLEVDSEKFHDYYHGLPLIYLNSSYEEYDVLGKHRSKLCFYHPIKDHEVELISNWRGGPLMLTVDKIGTIQHSTGWGGAIIYHDYIIGLSDGTELFFKADPKSGRNPGLFQKGDILLFLNEMVLKTSEEFKQFKGEFLIYNQRRGSEHYLQGTVRWFEEFRAWDPLTIVKNDTTDKVWTDQFDYKTPLKDPLHKNEEHAEKLLQKWKTTIELSDGRRFYFEGNPDIEKFWLVRNRFIISSATYERPSSGSIFLKDDPIAIVEITGQKYRIRNIRSGKDYWFFSIP